MNHYTKNLETGRLELHFEKAHYQALPAEAKANLKRVCLWSGAAGAWVSRSTKSHWQAEALAKELGLTDAGAVGEKLTMAEKVEAVAERAEARAERADARADKADAESAARHKAADAIASFIPFGQPILVGHHSEKRHRRDLEKIDGHMRKAIDAGEKAKHYERRAETARETAEGKQYGNPAFLGRRIAEQEAELRGTQRRIAEVCDRQHGTGPEVLDWLDRLEASAAETEDKLGFYRHCLEKCDLPTFSRETLKGKTAVKVRGQWYPIVKLNPKTVAVPNCCFPTEESQRKYAFKYPYCEVQDAR